MLRTQNTFAVKKNGDGSGGNKLQRLGTFALGTLVKMQSETFGAQHRTHEPKVDGEYDNPHGNESYFFGYAYGDEEFQRNILHEKVYCLA